MALTNPYKVAWGLNGLYIADLGKIATATWAQIGYVLEGSVSMNFDAPTANQVKVEELGVPILTKFEEGDKSIELDIPNVEATMVTLLTGATVADGVISFPDTTAVLRKMVKFEFKEGGELYFTNASIVANLSGGMTKTGTDTFNLHLTITPAAGLGGTTYEDTGIKLKEEE